MHTFTENNFVLITTVSVLATPRVSVPWPFKYCLKHAHKQESDFYTFGFSVV